MNTQGRKLLLIIGLSIILLAVITTVIYFSIRGNSTNNDHLTISNIDKYTSGKPTNKERLQYIEKSLFEVVNMNTSPPVKSGSVKDILIRDNTFIQNDDKQTGIHTVMFTVDIASLKQSYSVSYQWPDKGEHSTEIDEWGTIVKCLPTEDLIYGDFQCKDMFTQMTTRTPDSLIAKVLPHSTDFYVIRYYTEDTSTIISIQIMITDNSSRTKQRFEAYKSQAVAWLKEQGIDISKYTIEYRNVANDLVSTDLPDGQQPPESDPVYGH